MPALTPKNGLPMYYSNVEKDGVRSREKVYDPNDAVMVPLENIYPTVSGSIGNTFRYKYFDLMFNSTSCATPSTSSRPLTTAR